MAKRLAVKVNENIYVIRSKVIVNYKDNTLRNVGDEGLSKIMVDKEAKKD